MKKVLVLSLALLALGTTSCKKSGTCSCEVLGTTVSNDYDNLDNDEYQEQKEDCEDAGCDWSLKVD